MNESADHLQKLIGNMARKLQRDGNGTCMSCLKNFPTREIASIGVYIPNDPAITGKTRVVAYPVCLDCVLKPQKDLMATVEGNIIRAGIMLDPRTFTQ